MFEHCCLNIVIHPVKLEEAIKQTKPFKCDYQKAVVNLIYTHNWVTADMKVFFKKFNITAKQYNILRILRGAQKPVSTLFIRERLLDNGSDVSRIVDRMLAKGLINKSTCANDKRLVDLEITEDGNKLVDQIQAEPDHLNNIFKNLNAKEIVQFNKLLNKIRQ